MLPRAVNIIIFFYLVCNLATESTLPLAHARGVTSVCRSEIYSRVAVKPGLWTLDRKFDDHFLQFLMYIQVHGLAMIIYFVWSHRPEVLPYPDGNLGTITQSRE